VRPYENQLGGEAEDELEPDGKSNLKMDSSYWFNVLVPITNVYILLETITVCQSVRPN
jgi:hypothetical protein